MVCSPSARVRSDPRIAAVCSAVLVQCWLQCRHFMMVQHCFSAQRRHGPAFLQLAVLHHLHPLQHLQLHAAAIAADKMSCAIAAAIALSRQLATLASGPSLQHPMLLTPFTAALSRGATRSARLSHEHCQHCLCHAHSVLTHGGACKIGSGMHGAGNSIADVHAISASGPQLLRLMKSSARAPHAAIVHGRHAVRIGVPRLRTFSGMRLPHSRADEA